MLATRFERNLVSARGLRLGASSAAAAASASAARNSFNSAILVSRGLVSSDWHWG